MLYQAKYCPFQTIRKVGNHMLEGQSDRRKAYQNTDVEASLPGERAAE
jgi:hypothetical protein